jgi:hypothetical protein
MINQAPMHLTGSLSQTSSHASFADFSTFSTFFKRILSHNAANYHPISPKSEELWRSGSACDSSDADIHKVIRSNRVSFIVLTNHEISIIFLHFLLLVGWVSS